jgi:hypothetical protein
MKFTLIHPSRGRAEQAKRTKQFWIDRASGQYEIEHILSLDESDPQRNKYNLDSIVLINANDCVVQATNHAAKIATGDILIYLSDDFECPNHWDKLIVQRLLRANKKGSDNWLIKVDDCLQKYFVPVLTIPIMSKGLYNKLGYFWHPEYKSMFVDEHLYWVCRNNGWILDSEELKFPHIHPANGKAQNDETYQRSANNWNQGKALFAKHKLENFPI